MMIPREVVEEVRRRTDIVELIGSYVTLKRAGSNYNGLCPFHSERSPSFTVFPSDNSFYCFGCGVGGNAFTFIMEYENFTFVEALKYLAERAGVKLPEIEYSEDAKKAADFKSRLLEVNKLAAKYFYAQLRGPQGTQGLEYFKRRGLSSETMQKFGLGYANKYSDDLYKYFKSKNTCNICSVHIPP